MAASRRPVLNQPHPLQARVPLLSCTEMSSGPAAAPTNLVCRDADSATTPASASEPAATRKADRVPASVAGSPRSAPSSATPITPPVWRAPFSNPEARPDWQGSTEFRIDTLIAGVVMPAPRPITNRGTARMAVCASTPTAARESAPRLATRCPPTSGHAAPYDRSTRGAQGQRTRHGQEQQPRHQRLDAAQLLEGNAQHEDHAEYSDVVEQPDDSSRTEGRPPEQAERKHRLMNDGFGNDKTRGGDEEYTGCDQRRGRCRARSACIDQRVGKRGKRRDDEPLTDRVDRPRRGARALQKITPCQPQSRKSNGQVDRKDAAPAERLDQCATQNRAKRDP